MIPAAPFGRLKDGMALPDFEVPGSAKPREASTIGAAYEPIDLATACDMFHEVMFAEKAEATKEILDIRSA
jgi:hypothetical protein